MIQEHFKVLNLKNDEKMANKKRVLLICSIIILGINMAIAQRWEQAQEIVDAIKETEFPNRTFNVLELGAKGDGKHNDLTAIQSAINICNHAGGGRVVVPKGQYWLEGPIHFKSNVNLYLEKGSVIRFSAVPADFLPVVFSRWEGTELFGYSSFIYANNCTNIAITGFGTIDGNAKDTFATWLQKQKPDQNTLRDMGDEGIPLEQRVFGEGHWLRPSFIQFINCHRVKMEGVKVIESPFWIIHPVYSSNIIIRNLRIESFRLNNDGIDLDSSTNVLIEGCTFSTGDDAIVIKSGRDYEGRQLARPSENIVIRNNTCLEVHNGFAIGSEMSGSVRNVFIENNTIKSGRSLIYFKANLDRGGTIENVYVRNIDIEKATKNLIYFQTDYHSFRGGHFPPLFRNFHIENITCKEAGYGIRVQGHSESPITDVHIKNVTIKKAEVPTKIYEHDQVLLENVMINRKNYSTKK